VNSRVCERVGAGMGLALPGCMRKLGEAMWIANILLVGVAAFLGGQGLSAVADIALLRAMPAPTAMPLGASRTREPARSLSSEPILARNPFDSVTGSLLPVAHADAVEPAAEAYDPFHVPACAKVRAVVIASFTDPEASLAAFEVEGGEAVLRRKGGEIGASRVEYIAADRVFVREEGKICQAQLFGPPPVVLAKDRAPATPKPAEPGAVDPSLAKGIERLGPGRYRIERSVVERLLDDQAEIMKGGTIRPEKDGDRTVGVRLMGVRPDRLFGLLGMQDGDVMRSINGYEFSSPERMLEAYAHLREATELVVNFTRGGQATTSTYAIQ
jgi:general secretion pathway protein C